MLRRSRAYASLLRMEDEKLIEFVRKYEFLYNLKHPKYMDTTRKETAWKEIADQLQQSAAACKERWQNLRDAYRRALSKKKGKSGQAAKNTKPWKYENEMAFVVPFFVKRKLQESLGAKSEDEESDNGANEHQHSINQYNSGATLFMKRDSQDSLEIKIEDEESDNCGDDQSTDTVHNSIINYNNSENNDTDRKSKATKRKMIESEKTAPAILMTTLLADRDRYKPESSREHNELDGFFLNISDTVKKFSPYLQALAKNKIFNLVSEMELQQLTPPPSTSTSTK